MEKPLDIEIDDTPQGQHRRWKLELSASKRDQEEWIERAEKVHKVYIDQRDAGHQYAKKLNLFWSDVQTKSALLYGSLPKAEVSRRYADANDQPARVAAEMLGRVLNTDIERGEDTYEALLRKTEEDWLVPGIGIGKARYEVELEQVDEVPAKVDPLSGRELVPATPAHQRKSYECVAFDYIHWRDFRWSPCRTWDDMRWVAFGIPMSRAELVKKFGEEVGPAIPLDYKPKDQTRDTAEVDPAGRAYIWNIWSKEDKKVYWFSDGYPVILQEDDDPLGLDGFFPMEEPLAANLTTSRWMPIPDYYLAQALYQGCDELYRRICMLEEAIAVRGAYDADSPDLKRLLDNTQENFLVPAQNWARLTEKGGFEGAIQFLPIELIANVIGILQQKLSDKIQLLYQVTGMSDIMRGAAQQAATATEQAIKAQFGSVRSQMKQKQFSRFATGLLKIKAEIIAKHFDVQTIIQQSNIAATQDAPIAMQAAQLIKDEYAHYRIEVRDEQLSMPDLASLKREKTEFMGAVTPMLGQVMQVAQSAPQLVPSLLELMKWSLTGFKGASTAEGILDQGISQWEQMLQQKMAQPPQPPPPDPKLMVAQVKARGDIQKTQAELQADLVRTQAETQSEIQRQAAQAHFNIKEAEGQERAKAMSAMANLFHPEGQQ